MTIFSKIKTKIKNEPIMFLFAKSWKFAKGHRWMIVLHISMTLVSNIILLTQPLVFRELLNEIQKRGFGQHNIVYLITILFMLLLIELSFWLFHGPSRVIERKASFITSKKYLEFLLRKVLKFNLSWHGARDSGNSIEKVNKAHDAIYAFTQRTYNIIGVITKIIGTTIILMFFNAYISILALFILCFAFFIISRFDIKLIPQYKKLHKFRNKRSAKIFDVLSNITSIKILRIESASFSSIKKSIWANFPLYKKNIVLSETKWFSGSVLFTLIVVLPMSSYFLYSYKYNLPVDVGTVSAMYMYLSGLISVYFSFAGLYEDMTINKTRILNAKEIEDYVIESDEKPIYKINNNWKKLSLNNVEFKYQDAQKNEIHLDKINLKINKGEKIAFIGQSGSGKTTLLKVIHGLYNTANATFSVDNQKNISTNFVNIDLKTMLVPQEPEIFSSSLRENITFSLDYSDDEVMYVANLAEFTQVIEELPKGLDSIINEKGVNLSGGQKQRLALTRALLFSKEKEIILLDESTSSVDPKTEIKIYKKIFREFVDKTIFASVHKMNLLKYFDRIIILKNGKISDEGSFEELYKSNKEFKHEWDEYVKTHEELVN